MPAQYNPDRTKNYEIGAKTGWFGNKLTANVAAYVIDIYDLQVAELFGAGGAFSGYGSSQDHVHGACRKDVVHD